jgi:nucleotide-binding universal stress UspA family protein
MGDAGDMTVVEDRPGVHRALTGDGRWVVGVDGSACAENALDWAVANAPGRATGLELVTAWQTPSVAAYPMSSPTPVFDDAELRSAAASDLAAVADRFRDQLDIPVASALGHGGAAEVLLAAAEQAGLLVLGSRGRGGFARLLLGSTSTQCATHATVPTVVVPGDVEIGRARRILVGFDGSPNSVAAANWAVDFAGRDATLVVVWVWDATPLAVGSDAFFFPDASDLAAERFHHLLEPIDERALAAGVTIEREFVRGTPRAALSSHSDEVDLVVVGARGHGAVGSALLGSVSTWMLHHVHRPIAVIPIEDGQVEQAEDDPPPDVFKG